MNSDNEASGIRDRARSQTLIEDIMKLRQPLRTVAATLALAVLAIPCSLPVAAQSNVLAYPAKGQSADQAKKDEYECSSWARQRTGFNPSQRPPQVQAYYSDAPRSSGRGFGSGETGQGGVLGDGARGAALGAMGGAIAGNAGKGAAIGALGGAIFGGAKRSSRQQQEADWHAQQQAQLQSEQRRLDQQYQQQRAQYDNAYGLCLEGRGYQVRY
jgi:hypothetical protein